jgi:hypothetical protein
MIALLIVGVAFFAGIKVVPVRVNAYNFRDVLREEARMGAVRNSDSVVKERIMDRALDLEIPLRPENLTVTRTRAKMIITAKYEQPIDLKVTTYVYRFNAKEEAPLF